MRPEIGDGLLDIRDAGMKIRRMTDGLSFEAYVADDMVKVATERYFEIIGEALRRIERRDEATARKT